MTQSTGILTSARPPLYSRVVLGPALLSPLTSPAEHAIAGCLICPFSLLVLPGCQDLATFLEQIGCLKYLPMFEEQDVDLRIFLTLTETDLKEIGIT